MVEMDVDPVEAPVDWSDLPPEIVVQVFAFLSEQDRASAAVTCSRWHALHSHPSLWRYRTFNLGNTAQFHRTCDMLRQYPLNLAYYLKTFEAEYPETARGAHRMHHCKRIQKTMTTFLSRLRGKAQLRTLKLRQFELHRRTWQNRSADLVRSIAWFLCSQGRLRWVELQGMSATPEHGLRMFSSLVRRSGASIRVLNIQDYFCPAQAIYALPEFHQLFKRFRHLSVLYLNYNCVSDELLTTLAETCRESLTDINIKVFHMDPHFQRIWSMSWYFLRSACPKLQVTFTFERVLLYEDVKQCLLPDMPLANLELTCGNDYVVHRDWVLSPTVRYVEQKFTRTLQELSIDVLNADDDLYEPLLQLIQSCKKLWSLEVRTWMRTAFVDSVCQLKKEGKTILTTFKAVLVTHMDEETRQELAVVYSKHKDMIREGLLNYNFHVEWNPYL
ncbi:PREDICTED: F-box only protein 39-like isoform X1 [Branchiostoma belcheri]|uniref:F-box only protein 39-like isoform X1 n=1 Tax=Branchiostoma belcheri TaxID=7741 RepID=A0A6P4ZMG0_BRABE|nr:PREDICTED: F-box only protein 39-like isoform X1 [Branchiostoma belcheri]